MGAVAIKQEEAAVTGQEQARPPRLRVENVSLRYRTPEGGTFSALESVSFEVPDQQFAVIVARPAAASRACSTSLPAWPSPPKATSTSAANWSTARAPTAAWCSRATPCSPG